MASLTVLTDGQEIAARRAVREAIAQICRGVQAEALPGAGDEKGPQKQAFGRYYVGMVRLTRLRRRSVPYGTCGKDGTPRPCGEAE